MASRFRHKYGIETTRLNGYDYSKPGNYFITICTKDRKPLFGDIIDEKIKLSKTGKIVSECWLDLPNHYPNIILDEFIVMPNHIHGIIIIRNGSENNLNHGLSEFIRAFKSFSSRRINKLIVETGLRPVSTNHGLKILITGSIPRLYHSATGFNHSAHYIFLTPNYGFSLKRIN